MPNEIVAAVDEAAAQVLVAHGESALGVQATSGHGSLGPFGVAWSASVSLSGGTVSLAAPGTVSIDNMKISYNLSLTLSIDLSFLDFCLPQVCIPTPFGDICTPKICINFPTISVKIPFASSATLSGDFGLNVHLTAGEWNLDVIIRSVRKLDLGTAATLLITAIGAAISVALLGIPFIGPFLALAVGIITAAFGIAQVTGLLGSIVSVFVSGLSINVYKHKQTFTAIHASGPFDPDVIVTIAAIAVDVQATDKKELVLSADI